MGQLPLPLPHPSPSPGGTKEVVPKEGVRGDLGPGPGPAPQRPELALGKLRGSLQAQVPRQGPSIRGLSPFPLTPRATVTCPRHLAPRPISPQEMSLPDSGRTGAMERNQGLLRPF